jgi:iron complex transport system substrate-binding protein
MVYPDSFSDVNPTDKLDEISEFFLGEKLSSDLAAEGYKFEQLNIAEL